MSSQEKLMSPVLEAREEGRPGVMPC